MKRVYLIRHCLPDFPGGERMCLGVTDLPLGPAGRAQAEEMAARLPPVTAVYSSPLSRAMQTALAIGMPITVLEDLRELNFGAWDGLTFSKIRELYPALYDARGVDPSLPLPGEERRQAGLERFRSAMEEAAGRSTGSLAVVAHGGVISEFLGYVTGTKRKPGYGEIVPLLWDGERFYVNNGNP